MAKSRHKGPRPGRASVKASVRHWVRSHLGHTHHHPPGEVDDKDELRLWGLNDESALASVVGPFNRFQEDHPGWRGNFVTPPKLIKAVQGRTVGHLVDYLTDAVQASPANLTGAADWETSLSNWVLERLHNLCNGPFPTRHSNIKDDLDCGTNALAKLADAIPYYVSTWGADPQKFTIGATNITKRFSNRTAGDLIDFLTARVRAAR